MSYTEPNRTAVFHVVQLLQREFVVQATIEEAWRHLANVEDWTSWAHHIRAVQLQPKGALTETTVGRFHLTNGVRSTFRVTEYRPPLGWTWQGSFLWLLVDYEHRFEAVAADRTRMVWSVACEGFGASILGRLFALIYNRNLDKAIPRLQDELANK